MTITISEARDGELPIPYLDSPVGLLEYDGHEVDVWSIATTADGKVIYLNCSAADAALSATLKRLLRKSSGKAVFQPAEGLTWVGPTQLGRLSDHYSTITTALTHKGIRLKNQCVIPDSLHIGTGLSRPMETSPTPSPLKDEEEEESPEEGDAEQPEASEAKADTSRLFRYILGDAVIERPPTGALFATLKSMVVVCHPDWEATLWEEGKKRYLILPQPALGVHAWSITKQRDLWTDLVGELWMRGAIARPLPMQLLSARVHSRTKK